MAPVSPTPKPLADGSVVSIRDVYIYIYMTYICVIRVSLGNWFWNVEIHSVQCCHICFWSEVVSNSWTSKLKKQNSSYLTITKGSWEQIYLATKKHMALGGFNKQLHFLEEFLKQLKFPQSFRYQVLRFKENIHEFRRVGIVWNILIHPGKNWHNWLENPPSWWNVSKNMMTTEIFPWKLHINET